MVEVAPFPPHYSITKGAAWVKHGMPDLLDVSAHHYFVPSVIVGSIQGKISRATLGIRSKSKLSSDTVRKVNRLLATWHNTYIKVKLILF